MLGYLQRHPVAKACPRETLKTANGRVELACLRGHPGVKISDLQNPNPPGSCLDWEAVMLAAAKTGEKDAKGRIKDEMIEQVHKWRTNKSANPLQG